MVVPGTSQRCQESVEVPLVTGISRWVRPDGARRFVASRTPIDTFSFENDVVPGALGRTPVVWMFRVSTEGTSAILMAGNPVLAVDIFTQTNLHCGVPRGCLSGPQVRLCGWDPSGTLGAIVALDKPDPPGQHVALGSDLIAGLGPWPRLVSVPWGA